MIVDIAGFRHDGLPQGGARPSRFEVYFPQSPAVASSPNVADTILQAQAASLPDARIGTIDIYYQGRPVPVAGERAWTPWTVRFYNEIDFQLRDFFEAWNNRMNTFIGNQAEASEFTSAVNGGYAVDGVIVRQFSKQNVLTRSYVFFGMWPEVVGPIELNWEAANRIETFDVQFRYAYWVPSGVTNGPSGMDTETAIPGSYDIEGVPGGVGPGAIAITTPGAIISTPGSATSFPIS